MIKPYNSHVLIDPVKHESFIHTSRQTYQEIGTIVSLDDTIIAPFSVGDKVLFDAWLAKKYPKEGSDEEYFWLVHISNVVAYEPQVSEQSV